MSVASDLETKTTTTKSSAETSSIIHIISQLKNQTNSITTYKRIVNIAHEFSYIPHFISYHVKILQDHRIIVKNRILTSV